MEALRKASKLDVKSVRGYAWLFAATNLGTFLYLLATSANGIDKFGHLIGSDFLSFWAAGDLLREGRLPYDVAAHIAIMQDFAPSLSGYPAYFYPPLFLLACYPLGFLPYFSALGMWLVATGALFVGTSRAWTNRLGLQLPIWLWVAAFPPVLTTITHGQTSFLLEGIFAASLLMIRHRPWIAGLLIGLTAFKLQFGLLVPIVVLLTGNWRVAIAATASILVQAVIATLAFGPDIWLAWLDLTGQAQGSMASGNIGYGKMVTIFAATKLIGASDAAAYLAQFVASGLVALAIAKVSWRRDWSDGLGALLLAGAPLATPFALDYDLVILTVPLIYLAGTGYRDWEKSATAFVFVASICARPLALEFGVPIMPLALAALFWVLWRRLDGPQPA